MNKTIRILALALVLSLLLTACGVTTGQKPTSSVKELETLKVGLAAMLNQFDPGYSIGIASIKLFYNIFDTLLTTDKNGKITGQLAESWEFIDDKTLNVKIRKGVTFQNGEPCTAEDVKFTFDRLFDPNFGSGTVSTLFETVESVNIIDDYTVQFKTKIADPAILDRLGSVWGAYIVPKDYLEKIGAEAFQTAPIGTGPFMMSSYSPEKIVLTRYDGFWGDKPDVKNIEFILYPEASARVTALITGEVDIINDVTKDLVDRINKEDNLQVVGTDIKNIHIYVFNTAGPLKNQKLRQALTIAMNRQLLVDSLWSDYAYVPNGHQFKDYGDTYIEEYPGIKYDVEYAKQLVKESGYNGEEIIFELLPAYYMNGAQAGEAVADMWGEIGLNVKIRYNENWEWTSGWDVHQWSSASRFDDPLGALWMLFCPGSSPATHTWLDMPQDWIDTGNRLAESTDKAERRELAKELLRMFDTYCPGTYLYVAEDLYGVRDGFDWDMYYARNQIMPFRADDFKLAQ